VKTRGNPRIHPWQRQRMRKPGRPGGNIERRSWRSAIPIDERATVEVTHHGGRQLTPNGVGIRNPAFDVTPARYISAIITERAVLRTPYAESLKATQISQ